PYNPSPNHQPQPNRRTPTQPNPTNPFVHHPKLDTAPYQPTPTPSPFQPKPPPQF
ncbi:hypothetical protein Pcinc_026171, partial [Petrolisthes cinctipes]